MIDFNTAGAQRPETHWTLPSNNISLESRMSEHGLKPGEITTDGNEKRPNVDETLGRNNSLPDKNQFVMKNTFKPPICQPVDRDLPSSLVEVLKNTLPPILEVVPDLKETTTQYEGPCPHCGGEDRFFVTKKDPDHYYCRGCEKGGDVIDLHMKLNGCTHMKELVTGLELTPPTRQKKKKPLKARITSSNLKNTYNYTDTDGEILFYVGRYEEPGREKTFSQWHFKDGERVNSTENVKRVPYNLPAVMESDNVLVVEGEKDVDHLAAIGIVATCFVGSTWKDESASYFKDKSVTIIPDNDPPGEKLKDKIVSGLNGFTTVTKVLGLPGLPPKGDVSNWFDNGGQKNQLLELVKNVAQPVNVQAEVPVPLATVEDILGGFQVTKEYTATLGNEKWLYPNLIILGHILVIVAMPGGGKTAFLYRQVVPHVVKHGAKVFYIDADSPAIEHKWMKDFADKIGFMLINPTVNLGTGVDAFLKKLHEMVAAGVDLHDRVFIFDTLKKFTDLMNKSAVKDFFSLCRTMNSRGGTCIFLAHANKYRDADGNLIPEGVGDVKNDTDDLIMFERKKSGSGTDVTTVVDPDKGAKTRGVFKPFSFHITLEREIQLYDKTIEMDVTPGKTGRMNATAEEILSAAEHYIREVGAPVGKTALIEQVNDITGASPKRVRKVLSHNSEMEKTGTPAGKRLVYTLGDKNSHHYKVPSVPFQGELFDA